MTAEQVYLIAGLIYIAPTLEKRLATLIGIGFLAASAVANLYGLAK